MQVGMRGDDLALIVQSHNDAEEWNRGDASDRIKYNYHCRGVSLNVFYALRQAISKNHVSERTLILSIPEMIAGGNLHAALTNGDEDVSRKLKSRYGKGIFDLISSVTLERYIQIDKRDISVSAIKARRLNRLRYYEKLENITYQSGAMFVFLADVLQGYKCDERRCFSGMSSIRRLNESDRILFIARQYDILFDELLDSIAYLGSKHIYSLTQ